MADEAASLVIRISGDAEQLASTISSVSKQLQGLEQGGIGVSNNSQKAIDKLAKSTRKYSDVVKASKKSVEDKERALSKAEAEYKENKKAVDEAVKSQNLEKEKLDELNETLDKSKLRRDEASRAVKKANDEYITLSDNLDKVTALEKAYNIQDRGQRMKNAGEAINTVTKPLQTTALLLAAGGVASTKFAIDFEDNFAAVKKTVEGTPEQLEKVKQGIIDLTTVGINGRSALPMTTQELTELASAGGQLGISTDNIVEFTEVMAQMGISTNLVGAEGAASLARYRNVMNISESEIRNVGSSVVDLGNNMATTEAEIMEMANRMGKYGNTVHMGAADVLGYSAALSSLGIEAQLGGSAVGRTWLSIETAVAKGGTELQAFAKYSGKSAAEFKEQWGTDASGAFLDLLKGLGEAENLTLALDEVGINNTQDIQAIMSMASSYDLVAEAVGRANTAYKENNALQTEADKKAETTASQLQITKNNLVEAGRSIGEVILPSVNDATTSVTAFAQKLASLDESTQKSIVKVGATIIGLGAGAKVVSGTMKTVGELTTGWGKLMETLPALTKVGPLIKAGITSPAGMATLAVVGLGIAAKKTYDAWYKSEYLWAEGMSEQAAAISESTDKLTKLNSLKKEVEDLSFVIKSKKSSAEDVEAARTRLNEIAALLNKEYNLVINTDNSGLDDTAEKVENAVKVITVQERIEYNNRVTDYMSTLTRNIDKYKVAPQKIADFEKEKDKLEASYTFLSTAKNAHIINEELFQADQKTYEDYINERKRILGELSAQGFTLEDAMSADSYKTQIDDLQKKIDEQKAQIKELGDTAKNATNDMSTMLASDTIAGNTQNIEQDIEKFKELGKLLKSTGANTDELSMKFAAAKSGFTDFNAAIAAGKADEMAQSYMDYKESIGASAEEGVQGAALIKNGFNNVEDAVKQGDDAVKSVIKDLKDLASDKGIETTDKNLTKMAETMGLIPKFTEIRIDADGNIELVDKLQNALDKINKQGNVNIEVTTDGDVTKLDTVDEKLKGLWENNQVTIKFNADTSGFDILGLDGKLQGTITKDGKITWKNNVEDLTEDERNAVATLTWNNDVIPLTEEEKTAHGTLYMESVVVDSNPKKKARGTQNFEGGLAMVNDEVGISDPRELIIDRGHAFIPEGKDVILPLSKGAKVYTATQTKSIMNGLGIPRYASGKNNSDAFISARDTWSHYTKTHAVSVSDELKKWVEFSGQFKDNAKDIEDIEEQIFSLMRKQNEELNKQSEDYIDVRTLLNDWDVVGDDPISAYNRIQERNLANLNAGQITESEFNKIMTDFTDSLITGRIDQSYDWLEREQKYNNMSTEDYINGLDRMFAYLYEAKENMALSEKTYNEIYTKLVDERRDAEIKAAEEAVSAWEKSADNYLSIRETFNDWEDIGDSKTNYYIRSLERIEQLYQDGNLDWEDYMDMSREAYLNFYKAEEERLDTELDEFRDMINETEEKFREEEQALRDSWNVEDRATNKTEVERLLGIYENSVTEAGQKKYEELLEQKKEIEREEELYNLEQEHKEVLEGFEAEYKKKEEQNQQYLKTLHTDSFNIYSKTGEINIGVDKIKTVLETTSITSYNMLYRIASTLESIANQSTNTYNDSRKININTYTSKNDILRVMQNTLINGFANVM